MSVRMFRYEGATKHCLWWIAFVAEDGCLAVLSDYGDFTHRWPMHGMSNGQTLRDFLTGIDTHYLLSKVSRRVIDYRLTAKAIGEHFLENGLDLGGAEVDGDTLNAQCLRELQSIDSEHELRDWADTYDIEEETGIELHAFVRTDFPAQHLQFAAEVWPAIVAAITADIEANP